MTLKEQIKATLRSRKFWTLVASLATIYAGYATTQVTPWQALQAAIASLAAYSIGTALEGAPGPSGIDSKPPTPPAA